MRVKKCCSELYFPSFKNKELEPTDFSYVITSLFFIIAKKKNWKFYIILCAAFIVYSDYHYIFLDIRLNY